MTQNRRQKSSRAKRKKNNNMPRGTKRKLITALILFCTYIAVLAVLALSVTPQRYDIKALEIAQFTVKATRDVEDKITTQKRIDEARSAVRSIFAHDDAVTLSVLDKLNITFVTFYNTREQAQNLETEYYVKNTPIIPPTPTPSPTPDPDATPVSIPADAILPPEVTLPPPKTPVPFVLPGDFPAYVNDQLPEELYFTAEQIDAILLVPETALVTMRQIMTDALTLALDNGVRETLLDQEKKTVTENIENAAVLALVDKEIRQIGAQIIEAILVPNFLEDLVATEAARDQAAENTPHVRYLKGQNIVIEGELVTAEQWAVLNELGLLQNSDMVDYGLYAGFAIFALMLMLIFAGYMQRFEKDVAENLKSLCVMAIVLVTVLALTHFSGKLHPYVVPSAFGAMVICFLVNPRVAIAFHAITSMLLSLLNTQGTDMLTQALVIAFGGVVGIMLLFNTAHRITVLYAGFGVGIVNAAVIFAVGLMGGADIGANALTCLWGLGGGVLSGIITMGTLPLWESIFKLVTPMKLLELSNPNQPLLKRMLMEASGTYYHSLMVGNLAEAAADAIGANALLCRVGSYYHDIGKLEYPYFFGGNQSNENPHDSIAPELSSEIIIAHTTNGVALGQKHKLPKPILDIIAQHHGTSATIYFYNKAREMADNPADVKREQYTYPGSRPQTVEAAIVMMADTCEAAVRAMKQPSLEQIDALIRKLVKDKMQDEQFDDCNLTMRDIDRICDAFTQSLKGTFHERIVYPSMDITLQDGK